MAETFCRKRRKPRQTPSDAILRSARKENTHETFLTESGPRDGAERQAKEQTFGFARRTKSSYAMRTASWCVPALKTTSLSFANDSST